MQSSEQPLANLTPGGCSRQANAVFRTSSSRREHSISKRERGSLEASQCCLQSDLPMRNIPSSAFPADERLSHKPDLSVSQPSIKNCCSLPR